MRWTLCIPFCLVLVLTGRRLQAQQDTIHYRATNFHGAVSDFILLAPDYPKYRGFSPAALLSVKSNRTDSTYTPYKRLNFSIMMGLAASRYLFYDADYFVNFLDKDPYHVFSKRFWGGFGINYRRALAKKLVLDADFAPCIQINVDKSEETKTDTSGWNSVRYENIYQGLHANLYCKLEYQASGELKPFFSLAAAVPILHSIARDEGDEPYHNRFAGQLFIGIGISYCYKSRRITEAPERRGKS
jgi:hypothetical protein